jgi:hypothetical protein
MRPFFVLFLLRKKTSYRPTALSKSFFIFFETLLIDALCWSIAVDFPNMESRGERQPIQKLSQDCQHLFPVCTSMPYHFYALSALTNLSDSGRNISVGVRGVKARFDWASTNGKCECVGSASDTVQSPRSLQHMHTLHTTLFLRRPKAVAA